jgi:hypothetical protein
MQTVPSDIADLDAWTLSHDRRPKLYQSIQGRHVNLARAHKVWFARQVYVTSSVSQNN